MLHARVRETQGAGEREWGRARVQPSRGGAWGDEGEKMPCFVERMPPERQGEVRRKEEGRLLPGKTWGRRNTHSQSTLDVYTHTLAEML